MLTPAMRMREHPAPSVYPIRDEGGSMKHRSIRRCPRSILGLHAAGRLAPVASALATQPPPTVPPVSVAGL